MKLNMSYLIFFYYSHVLFAITKTYTKYLKFAFIFNLYVHEIYLMIYYKSAKKYLIIWQKIILNNSLLSIEFVSSI